jgi:hypothetical protein
MQTQNLRVLKVQMNTRSLWSDGALDHYAMAKAAMGAGYDVIFFADNALQFWSSGELADPSFSDVNATGGLNKWTLGILGTTHSVATAEVLTLPPPPSAQSSGEEAAAYYFALERIKSGAHAVHLAIQSASPSKTPVANLSYAFVRDNFPAGYVFNQTSEAPSHPLLLNDLTFSVWAFLDHLGYIPIPGGGPGARFNASDNGWFYVRFYLVNSAHPGPASISPIDGVRLTVTLVYSDHPPDNYIKTIRHQLNTTTSKVIYLNVPPLGTLINPTFNITDLAGKLWNESIVENWRLGNFEIGTRSVNDGLVDAYISDVSIKASKSVNPVQFFRDEIQSQLSTSNFAAYCGYSVDIPNQLPMYVYGTSYLDLSRTYNLTDPVFWKTITNEVSSHGGTVMLGPFGTAFDEYVALTQAFGARIMDATTFPRISTAATLLGMGGHLVFAALSPAYFSTDYNSSAAWSMRVLSKSNSEADVLEAIANGNAYLAVFNFTGTFEVGSFAFPVGRNPVYVPSGQNASLRIVFTGLSPGLVRVYGDEGLVSKQEHNGTESLVASLRMLGGVSHFYVTLTSANDSLAVVGNPLTFAQTSMLPGGALYIDNGQWSLESSEWNSNLTEQRFRVVVGGPAGTNSDLYLYSPEFRPDAKSQDTVARSIQIGNVTIDPATIYDIGNSTFVMQLHSSGEPLVITFNFDIPTNYYAYLVLQSVVGLYALAILPFAVILPYTAAIRRRKARRLARRDLVSRQGHET